MTGEVGTFDMYAKFTVTKYLFTQPTQMILQWYTNVFKIGSLWMVKTVDNYGRYYTCACSNFVSNRFNQKWGYGIWYTFV